MKHVSCLAALLSASLAVAQEPSTDAGEMDAVVSSAPADAGMDAGIDAGSAAALWEKPVTFPLDAASRTAREGKDGVLLETRVLIDRAGAGADRAVLLHVTAYAGIDLFPHRHEVAELVYVLEGSARVRGASGRWTDLEPGDAVYLAPGVGHGLFFSGNKARPAKLLLLYAPPGKPSPSEPGGIASIPLSADEIRKPNPQSPSPKVMRAEKAPTHLLAQNKGWVRIAFDAASAGDGSAYVGLLHAEADLAVPEHVHTNEAELLYVVKGRGEMTFEGRPLPVGEDMAVHVPAGRRHAFKVTGGAPFEAVQFYAPSGPEQRFKAGPKKR